MNAVEIYTTKITVEYSLEKLKAWYRVRNDLSPKARVNKKQVDALLEVYLSETLNNYDI